MKQSGSHVRFSAVDTAKVKQVKFALLSKEQIQRWTICQINQSKLYQNKIPTKGGLNDLRLGVSSSDQKCQTCGETRECPGHFGRIKLTEPIYHYGYLKFVEKVLKCICHSCSRMRRPRENDLEKFKKICEQANGRRRLINLSKLLVGVNKCQSKLNDDAGCNDKTPTKVQIKNHKIYVSYKQGKKDEDSQSDDNEKKPTQKAQPLPADKVYKILDNIIPADAKLMGFVDSKPINLLITSLLVCPPQVRPSIQMNPQKKAQDNITAVYNKIINTNNQLKKQVNKNDHFDRGKRIEVLQRQVASIMEKTDRRKNDQGLNLKIKQGSKAIKSFSQRLKGKQGRFRQHLMGKRVDFSARSVISPDSNLALDQLGVPQKIANSLTFPQQITNINIQRIKQLCQNGKILYILKPSEDKKKYQPVDLTKGTDFEKDINIGMIAERCLQDGDFVLFNRQPTLHRMSMMGHRVRILPYSTFRLNLSVCTPYNADFDGDEMNMHVPQSYQSLSQIKHIAHVPRQIVTPKNNAPVMGMVQDALLGIYLFTLRDTFLTRQQIMNLVIWIQSNQGKQQFDQLLPGQLPMPAILKPQPLWTGKQVMSIIIPSKITAQLVKDKQRDMVYKNVKDVNMIIKKGQLITGALQKEMVGSGAGGLIHTIWLEIGPDATNYFITTAQRIVNNWLIMNSFTVGAQDIVPTSACQQKITQQKIKIQNMYYDYLNKFRSQSNIKKDNLHHRGKHIMESLQFHINQNLNGKLKQCQTIITQSISPYNNNIYKMIWAKSKGSETNLAQIVGMLANQNVDGHRCPEGFSRRALPHFYKDDLSPEPRGFVYSSFYKGLGPHQFFFHSMGGREGLSDTAVKTSRTGYIQRKLIKALEDVIVKYDGTVRDSQNNIIQRLYGQDGFAAEYIEKQAISFQQPLKKFQQRYKWDIGKLSQYKINSDQYIKTETEYEKLKQCRKRLRQIFLQSAVKDIYCPIKIQRLINNLKPNISFFKENKTNEPLSPLYVYDEVQKLLDVCIHPQFVNQYKAILEKQEQFTEMTEGKRKEHLKSKIQFERLSGLQMFRIHIRMALASKVICENHKLDKKGFNAVIQLIKDKFRKSLIHPGQAIGAISAQCVGQPTTQMTLNTFHLAGVAATNVTLGVPRLQQLLDASRKMKTPSLSIYLNNMVKVKCTQAQDTALFKIMNIQLPQRYLSDYIIGTKIYYDPNTNNERLGQAKSSGLQFFGLQNDQQTRKKTPWVLQLSFDKQKKITSPQVWDDLKGVIQRCSKNEFEFIETQTYNDAETILDLHLRCYQFNETSEETKKFADKKTSDINYYSFICFFQHKLKKARIGGIDGIKRVVKKKQTIIIKDKNGQQLSKDQYWILQTDGSNLKAILSNDLVDPKKTITNDMTEVLTVLGIEAARQSFLNQFRSVLRPYSIYINYRHLATLSDWMTRRGTLTPINRNGINRIADVSILRKASFEETVEILYDAAVFSESDPLKGISQKIIFGQPVEIGTGNFKILIDKVKVKDFKTHLAQTNPDDVPLEQPRFNDGGNTPNIGGTPLPMNTPGPFPRGASSIRQPFYSNTPNRLISSPSFTPNIYDNMNRFTPEPDRQYGSGSISQRSPMITGTPLLPMGRDYSPSSSPTYTNNNMSPSVRPNSPYTNNYNIHGPISPYYTSSVSPSYASSHNRANYPSSRMAQSPRYESPLSNNQHSAYTNSPSYGGTPIMQRGAKQEELSDEDDG